MKLRIDRSLELFAAWVLLTSGLGLLLALCGHFLAPQVFLGSLLLVTAYAWRTRSAKMPRGMEPIWHHIVLLVVVSLLFRLPAYHYVLGGQDEGLYVNIAHHIQETGGIRISDTVLRKLQGTPYVNTYLAQNHNGIFVPGVYLTSQGGTGLQFQFYHLFPMWMALFGGLFGSTSAVYALSLFALLSVLFFYRLALAVSGSTRVAFIAGMLLAVCPLHVFFSKFPVTEVPTLAFSLIGFTYLVLYRENRDATYSRRWLWMAAWAFGALFFTRISGFMYMPFLIALAVAGAIADPDRVRQRGISLWAIGVVGLYATSVWYGLHWSSHYSRDIYRLSFEPIFGRHWRVDVAGVVLFVLLGWFTCIGLSHSQGMRHRLQHLLLQPARNAIGPILMVGLIVGLFKIYRLGWTHYYDHDGGLGAQQWGLAHAGMLAAKASSLVQLMVYMGPAIPLGFLVAAIRKRADPHLEFLRLFVVGFFVYIVTLQWVVPYGPYYARYLLSELLPYMLLFVVLTWPIMVNGSVRKWIVIVLGASALYMVWASAAQLGKNENDGLYASLKQLLAPVDSSDLVLIDNFSSILPTTGEIKTPILYTFDRDAVTIDDKALNNHAYLAALDARYDDIYLLSRRPTAPSGFVSMGSTRVKDWVFQPTHMYPHNLMMRGDIRLYLYRLQRPTFPLNVAQSFRTNSPWSDWMRDGWASPEAWGVWSDAHHAELDIDPRQILGATAGLRLTFDANVFVTPSHPRQRIGVSMNSIGVAWYEVSYPNRSLTFTVDVPADVVSSAPKIRIDFELPDAVSPKSIGMSTDDRILAFGLKSVLASPLAAPPGNARPERKAGIDRLHLIAPLNSTRTKQ